MYWALNAQDASGGSIDIGLGFMPQSSKRQFKGQYQVVFDGSGTIDQDRATVYAGATSSIRQWAAFAEVWDNLLVKHDLAYVKFSEADTFYGEFLPKASEWGTDREKRRDALLLEFVSLRSRYALSTTGCGVVLGTEGTTPFTAQAAVSKKKELFQCAILALLRGIPKDFGVQVVCDVEKDAEDHYRGWIESLMRVESDKVARIVVISFADDKVFQPVQFADLIAGITRKELERRMRRPDQPVSQLYEMITEGAHVTFEPIARSGLLSGMEIKF
jgi:hypothetical protein